MTRSLIERCKTQLDIDLTIRDAVKKHLVEVSYDPKYGARPLAPAASRQIWKILWQNLFFPGDVKKGSKAVVTKRKGKIVFYFIILKIFMISLDLLDILYLVLYNVHTL